MPSVAWRDEDEETAVRDEVDGVLGRLTRDWAVSRDGARGAGPTGRTDDASAVDLDAVFDDGETQTKRNAARFLHRSAEDEEVRAVLESMRRATLGLTERDLRAARMRRERNDDGTLDRVHLDRDAPEPYVMDGVLPPWYAKTYYKVVAVVRGDERDGTDAGSLGFRLTRGSGGEGGSGGASVAARSPESGRVSFVSVYDGVTEYAPGTTVCHPSRPDHKGGLYVSKTIEGCLRRDRDLFPERSALLHFPRAVARARCWNPDRADDPVFYGSKLAFTCVHVDEILPYPTTWGAGDSSEASEAFLKTKKRNASPDANAHKLLNELSGSPPARSPLSARSPPSATSLNTHRASRSPARAASGSPGGSPSSSSGKDAARAERQSASLLKAQAETVRLEAEVRAMERRLERTRFGAGADI